MTTSTLPPRTELSVPYRLPDDAVAQFDRDGFVHLPQVLSTDAIAYYEPIITTKVIELNTNVLPMDQRDTYAKAFLQVSNLWQHDPAVSELVHSERLARIAAELLGVDGVRLYHDQALYKEPSGGITPWHADQYYWPLSSDRCCTIWLPLQETPTQMGPLSFARGSHRFSYGRDLRISDESEARLQTALAEQDFEMVSEPFALGDASFHLGWTFHHAGPNTSTDPRRVMTIIYVDADIEATEPVNDEQANDLAVVMPGVSPGQRVSSPLNPELYRAAAH